MSVLIWHNLCGFFPERTGIFPSADPSKGFTNHFWFALIYGTAAVAFFFVLSGFVLTRRYFLSGDATQIRRNVVKRWPRLALPVVVTVLFSSIAFHYRLYPYQAAAVITQSWWLYYFGNAILLPLPGNLWEAFQQGSYLTFFHGDNSYDSSLWTMRFEFIGSFMAMGLALLLQPTRSRATRVYLIAVVLVLCHFSDPQYAAFPVGAALALFLPENPKSHSRLTTAVLVAVALYLLGWAGAAIGDFRPLGWLLPARVIPSYVNVAGSVLLIFAAETSPSLHSFLSGRWAVFLGRISFPLYLVHVPILCSVGSAVLLRVSPRLGAPRGQLVAMAATMVASFVAAYPLTLLNEWWVSRLNGIVGMFMPPTDSARRGTT